MPITARTLAYILGVLLVLEGLARLSSLGLPSSWDLLLIWALQIKRRAFIEKAGSMQSRKELMRLGQALDKRWGGVGGVPPANFSPQPQPGSYRIFCVGASTTVGWPLTFGSPPAPMGSYPQWLAAYLSDLLPQQAIEVINAGFINFDSYRNIRVIEEILPFKPRLVILYEGYNELSLLALRNPQTFYRALIVPFHFRLAAGSRLYNLLRKFLGLDNQPYTFVPALLSPAQREILLSNYEKNILRMIALIRSAGATPVLISPVYNPVHSVWQAFDFAKTIEDIRMVNQKLAREHSLLLIDPADRLKTRHFLDYYHLSPEGNRRLACSLLRVFHDHDVLAPKKSWHWARLKLKSARRRRADFGITPEILVRIYVFMAYANFRLGFLPPGDLLSRARGVCADEKRLDTLLAGIPDPGFAAALIDFRYPQKDRI